MEERREITRTHVQKNVQIVVADRVPPIDCVIRNVTSKGAGLSVLAAPGLPIEFEMSFDLWRSLRRCRLVWRRNKEVGVEFVP